MDLGIQGKVALVMGAGGGLGGAIARSLARESARVAVCDIDQQAAAQVVDAIRQAGGTAQPFVVDLSVPERLDDAVAFITAALGPVDILVNNSGGPPPGPAAGVAPDTWRRHFDAMVLSLIRLTDLVLPGMRERRWGRVITSASSGIIVPIENLALSNALRMTLLGWSKTLAAEVGRDEVTVNIVIPGRIATDRIAFLDRKRAEREKKTLAEVEAESVGTIPVGRYGRVHEYGDAVAFLASDNASFITGSVLRVDGGMVPSV